MHRFSTGGAPPSRELGSGARVKNASATKCDAAPKPITGLFELDDPERLKASKVGEYTLSRSRYPRVLQNVSFAYAKGL